VSCSFVIKKGAPFLGAALFMCMHANQLPK
jgi:hypothetical protein